jgi:micrococcal nuclease
MLKPINAMQSGAKAPGFWFHHQKIVKVVDGDGLWITDFFSKRQIEIRLLGIDAPEIKRCRKLHQDERETHLPGQLLIELGHQSWEHLRILAPIGESVSILTESKDPVDPYGRTLAYVFLPDRTCLNEKMILNGFAKPYDRYFCSRLADYQILSSQARLAGRGLFSRVNNF